MSGPHLPTSMVEPSAAALRTSSPDPDVGAVLRRLRLNASLTAQELEQHILDLGVLWKRAYERFEAHADPKDRDEALQWLHRQNEAILLRSPEVLAARHAEFERRIAEGCGYFIDQARSDRERLARGGTGGRN